jgi:Domain of unknown function (DUF4160)
MRSGSEAKFWLRPEVAVAHSVGFDARTLRLLVQVVTEHRDLMERAWNDYFG